MLSAKCAYSRLPSDGVPARFGFGELDMIHLMTTSQVIHLCVSLLTLAAFWRIRDHRRRRGRPYPPGPRPLPIIGNLLDIPKQFSWLAYSRFSQTYGNHSFASGVFSSEKNAQKISFLFVFLEKSSLY